MKKKVLAIIFMVCIGLCSCACGKEQPAQNEVNKETEVTEKNGDNIEISEEADVTSDNESTSVEEISVKSSNSVSDNSEYTIHVSVRPVGGTKEDWTDMLEVSVGDEVEYQIDYKNTSDTDQYKVVLRDILPDNVEYIPGTTRLWNSSFNGVTIDQDDLVTENGINIGGYGPGANAYVRFNARIVDENLACGSNTLVNWGQGWIGDKGVQDYANVHLDKE